MGSQSDTVEVPVSELRKVFLVLEELQQFLHQPLHYEKVEQVQEFLDDGAYKRLHDAYYETVWNWLPRDLQEELENR